MEDKVNYTLVGVFVLVLGAALVGAVLWLAAGGGTQKRYEPFQVIVRESVAGLNIDAPVKYLGVDVGKVREISIDPQNSRQVRLLLLIERGTPINQDTLAVLKTQGLTGIAYVELNGGSAGSPPLVATVDNPIPTIRSAPSLIARLENVFSTVLANLDRTTANLNAVLDPDNRAAFKKTLADTATLVHTLAAQQEAIGVGIAAAAQTASNAARASEKLAPTIERIAASADAVAKMADDVARTSASAGRTVDAAASGVQQLGAETIPELDRLLGELTQLAASLRELSAQTGRNPSSLLLGAPTRPPGPGERARP